MVELLSLDRELKRFNFIDLVLFLVHLLYTIDEDESLTPLADIVIVVPLALVVGLLAVLSAAV